MQSKNAPKPVATAANSNARAEANRRNAQKSTGPRSAEGKARAAANATKHGLRSEANPLLHDATLPGEQEQYKASLAALTADLAPDSALETQLVERLASLQLRLNRITRIESGLFARELDSMFKYDPAWKQEDPAAPPTDRLFAAAYSRAHRQLNLLSYYEARLTRDFHRTLAQLRQTQAMRMASVSAMAAAKPPQPEQKLPNEPNSAPNSNAGKDLPGLRLSLTNESNASPDVNPSPVGCATSPIAGSATQ